MDYAGEMRDGDENPMDLRDWRRIFEKSRESSEIQKLEQSGGAVEMAERFVVGRPPSPRSRNEAA